MANPIILGPVGFNGGLNLRGSYTNFPPNQMSLAYDVNVIYDKLARRGGSFPMNAAIVAASSIDALGFWNLASTGVPYLIAHLNNELWWKNMATNGSWARMGGAGTASGTATTFTSMSGYLISGIGGAAKPLKWDGTTLSDAGATAPNGNIVLSFNNFLFVSGDSSNPNRVYWSNVVDPTVFSAGNYVDYKKDSGLPVTSIVPGFNNDIYIFTKNSIGSLSTTSTVVNGAATLGPLQTIQDGIGCIGINASDVLPDGRIVFMDRKHHIQLFNGSSFYDISDKPFPYGNVQSRLDGFQTNETLSVVRVFPSLHEIWVLAPFNGVPGLWSILVYNYQQDIWESEHRIDGTALCAYYGANASGFPNINGFALSDKNGVVYDQNYNYGYDEDSTGTPVAISASATMPVYTKNYFDNLNNLSLISIPDPASHANANNLYTVNWGFNGRTETILNKSLTYNNKSTTNPYRQVVPLQNRPGLISNVVVNFSCSNIDNAGANSNFSMNPFLISNQTEI